MARVSQLPGWKKVVVYGVVSVAALAGLVVLMLAVVVGWAAMGAAERGDAEPVATSRSIPLPPVARLASVGGEAGTRLEIELTDGDFEIHRGEPGSDVRIEGELVGNYYELVEEREGVGRDGAVTAVRLRATTSSMVRMMASLMGDAIDGASNRLAISIPPDRPVSLVLDVRQGRSRIDLGGLHLTGLEASLAAGDHRLAFSEPLVDTLPELTVSGQMGNIELAELGNARVARLKAASQMGNFLVDLSGAWRADEVPEVSMEHRMGDMQVRVPTSIRLSDDSAVSATFAEPVRLNRDGETSDPNAPQVKLDLELMMAGMRVQRMPGAMLDAVEEAGVVSRSIPAPTR